MKVYDALWNSRTAYCDGMMECECRRYLYSPYTSDHLASV